MQPYTPNIVVAMNSNVPKYAGLYLSRASPENGAGAISQVKPAKYEEELLMILLRMSCDVEAQKNQHLWGKIVYFWLNDWNISYSSGNWLLKIVTGSICKPAVCIAPNANSTAP